MILGQRAHSPSGLSSRALFFAALATVQLYMPGLATANSSLYLEANAIGGYSLQDRFLAQKGAHIRNSLGFEYFGKFANEQGDFLTANLQVRVSHDAGAATEHPVVLEIHGAWMDIRLGWGRYLRLGHFAPAFGLEEEYDSHASLFQTLAHHAPGFKKDWGIGVRRLLGPFDLSMAAQLGSGMGLAWRDNSFLLSSRLTNPTGRELRYGVSALFGKVLAARQMRTFPFPQYSENAIWQARMALDMGYHFGPILLLGEVILGRQDDTWNGGALLQVDYTVPSLQELTLALQASLWSADLGRARGDDAQASGEQHQVARFNHGGHHGAHGSHGTDAVLGLCSTYRFSPSWILRVGFFQDLTERPAGERDTQVLGQLYYLGRVF